MRRCPAPMRRTPLSRSAPLRRGKPLARGGPLRRTALETRSRDTGPSPATRTLVHERSGDRCEWPDCPRMRKDVHHRLNRKDGGRHGEMRERLNGPAWLLDACRYHHRLVTNAAGDDLVLVESMGWRLREFTNGHPTDARTIPVLTRHHPDPVLLDNAGDWAVAG